MSGLDKGPIIECVVLDDGTAEITRYSGNADSLTIPEKLDNHTVTSIDDKAFFSCSSLTSVTIPDSVTSIGANPFEYCTSLKSISVSPDQPALAVIDGVLFSKADKRLVCYPCAFTSESYSIPKGIYIIGDGAFNHCSGLTFVTIPDSVTFIGASAFTGCDSLTSVTIPDSVTSIGTNPFEYCTSLESISVSLDQPALAVIDGVLFSKADKRLVCYPCAFTSESYSIPKGTSIIGDNAFSLGSSLKSVTIPDSVTSIGAYAFSECYSLKSVTIPDSVTAIGDHAFFLCRSLKSITLSNNVKSISAKAFNWCVSLTSVTIPDNVTSIGDDAFSHCSGLTSVTIPGSVASIGAKAFSDCNEFLTLTVDRDSYARQYCKENGLKYTYPDINDWLNNSVETHYSH